MNFMDSLYNKLHLYNNIIIGYLCNELNIKFLNKNKLKKKDTTLKRHVTKKIANHKLI